MPNTRNKSFIHNFKQTINKIIQKLSFNETTYHTTEALNHTLEEPPVKLTKRYVAHPGGFGREFGRRRLTIAEAYIIIAKNHEPEHWEDRLEALRILAEQSLHAKTISMPLNTARVQISLMKDAVKAYGNIREQMEKVHDFGRASFGQESVIRDFLNELSLIELPEEDKELKEMDMGWDDHVHDSLSEGRKTPTHVLLDAFVKGISKLTLVYNTISEERMIREAIAAGNILGIKVNIGIEFSVGKCGKRRHYMYKPPYFESGDSFFDFMHKNAESLKAFNDGLQENEKFRQKTIISIIEQFNNIHLPRLNEEFPKDSPCWFPPLKVNELLKIVASGQPSREHLRELLYLRFKSIFRNRVLFFKTQLVSAKDRVKKGIYSQWELTTIETKYKETRKYFEELNRYELANQYLAPRDVVDYNSAIESEIKIMKVLNNLPGEIVMLHPLELGPKNSIRHIINLVEYIPNVETMNLRDSTVRNPSDVIVFNKFIFFLNNKSAEEILNFLEQQNIKDIPIEKIIKAKEITAKRPIKPNCGSDSTGRNRNIPGMGFLRVSKLTPAIKADFLKKHVVLPQPVSDIVINKGVFKEHNEHIKDSDSIVCLGKELPLVENKVGDEQQVDFIGFRKLWTYLNTHLKNFSKISIGFAVALYWMYIIQFDGDLVTGTIYASIWFFITFFRNVFVDIIAASGTNFKNWTLKNVNFENAYNSVFWTGFSVPVLGMVKNEFDVLWPFASSGTFFEGSKFFFICVANGIYICSHNTLRNFDKKTIRGNFFRSMLSWPFATVFAPIGNFLTIPSIVQAKFWSDVVAAMIEGSGKFSRRLTLRKRDLTEILPKLYSKTRDVRTASILDVLYIWSRAPRGKTCLRQLLLCKPSLGERIWKKKESKEQFEAKCKKYKAYFEKLLSIYRSPGILAIMTNFALANFSGKDAVALTELIGRESGEFLVWLEKLEAKFPKK